MARTTLEELRRVARYKGKPELTCELCGMEDGPSVATRRLEVETAPWRAVPTVRCRAYVACERRVKRLRDAGTPPTEGVSSSH